ncbi:arginase family protein, partial [Verrucomicrobiota bacterium]
MNNHSYFLDIDQQTSQDPSCPYAVLPLPYERTVTYGTGTAQGPAAILRASHEIEDFDEEFLKPMELRAQTLPSVNFKNLSDEQALELIKKTSEPIMRSGRFLLSLGGEHTISGPLINAAVSAFGEISILHLDAHLDL